MNSIKGIVGLLMVNAAIAWSCGQATAQVDCGCYQVVPQTVYQPQQVTTYRLLSETVYEKQQHTSYKPVYVTEKRERRYKVLKPVTETSERTEEVTVLKPVVETAYKERVFEETYLVSETEMQDKDYIVEKPVTETSYREQSYIVRKPVTETVTTSENVTVYRPTTTLETTYALEPSFQTQFVPQPATYSVPRLQYFRPGYYANPLTGGLEHQRGGLRWSQLPQPQSYALQNVPTTTLVPQQVARTTLTPETVTVQKPVEMTRYVDEVVTQKVPVETQKIERQIVTQKVPVTVQREKKRYVTERVPVETVRYVPQIEVRKVPVTQTRFEEIERVEPYEVQVLQYVAETKEVEVPKTVLRREPITSTRFVPQQSVLRLPLPASTLTPVETAVPHTVYSVPQVVDSAAASKGTTVNGETIISRKLVNEKTIPVPPTDLSKPQTGTSEVEKPATPPSEDARTGDDSAQKKDSGMVEPQPEAQKEADKNPNLNNG